MNWKKLILTGVIGLAAPLVAQQGSCNYDNSCCESYRNDYCTNVFVDWLYWNVRDCGLDFVWDISETNQDGGDGHLRSINTDYESGFRVGAFAPYCGYEFGFVYTRYKSDCSGPTRATSTAGSLVGTKLIFENLQANINDAVGEYDVEFQQLDLAVGRHFQPQWLCNTDVTLGGGVRIAWIERDKNITYQDSSDITNIFQKVENDAYGLFLGMISDTQFCNCFSLFSDFSIAALVAETEQRVHYAGPGDLSTFDFVVRQECDYCPVVNVNLALGLGFDFSCFCDAVARLAVGYEFHNWISLPGFTDPFALPAVSKSLFLQKDNNNLGFDGLFVRLAINF